MSNQEGKVSRETRGHIFLIGLDRASKRNAFDSHLIKDLSLALTEYENNDALRCAIIFAHGDHFTAGLDWLSYNLSLLQACSILMMKKLTHGVQLAEN